MYLQCRTLRIFEIKLCLSALSSVARYAWNFRHWFWKENKSIIIVFLFLFTESALTPKFDLLEFFLKHPMINYIEDMFIVRGRKQKTMSCMKIYIM